MTEERAFTPSLVTANKYQLLMELGRGGMGVVHLAVSRGPQGFTKLVVLKMMRKQLVGDKDSHRMFLEEARISSRLTHPNIVHVYEVIEYDGVPTLVMEYLEGQTLWSVVRNPSLRFPLGLQLHVLSKVLGGLHAAHELRDYDGTALSLIHRDVSPHNVFVNYDGQVKVLDFGIAKATNSEVETRAGELKGKIRYMPPEQLMRANQDRRVDVFAVGVMLWEALAQRRYWGEKPEGDVINCLLAKDLPRLPTDIPIAPALAAICNRALAPNPADRYTSAGELQRELESCMLPELVMGPDDLGAFMRERFGPQREAAQKVVEAHLHAAEHATAMATEGETRILTPQTAATPTSSTERTRRPGVMTVLAVGVVAALVVAVVSLFGGRSGRSGSAVAAPESDVPSPPALVCGSSFKACEGQCVSVDRPDRGCGADACHACNVQNATARCNQLHRCDIAVCYQDFDDCDGDSSNGCETNVRIDPDHCGGCGRKCPALPHAQRGCGDACTIWRCDSGYRDCNAVVSDGCEAAVAGDAANCGECGHACKSGQKCRHGECS
jgi:hypothetical protein